MSDNQPTTHDPEDQLVEWLIEALLDAGVVIQEDDRIHYDQAA